MPAEKNPVEAAPALCTNEEDLKQRPIPAVFVSEKCGISFEDIAEILDTKLQLGWLVPT